MTLMPLYGFCVWGECGQGESEKFEVRKMPERRVTGPIGPSLTTKISERRKWLVYMCLLMIFILKLLETGIRKCLFGWIDNVILMKLFPQH
jgi:hypothetical protein